MSNIHNTNKLLVPTSEIPTAAFNANEVANVYMSFNRNDLKTESIKNATPEEQVKPGFYGMADPLNLRSTLERFECDFNYGPNDSHYRLRMINPTTDLERALVGFYDSIYPDVSGAGIVERWDNAAVRNKTLNDVTGEADQYYASLGAQSAATLPTMFLRWGYGKLPDNGLSRIHKVRLVDIKYTIEPNKDKVLEVQFVDNFTFTKSSNVYNNRERVAGTSVLKPDGTLKRPADIIQEVIAKYSLAYPGIIPLCNLYSNSSDEGVPSVGEQIDTAVQGIALDLATADKEAARKEETRVINHVRSVFQEKSGKYKDLEKERKAIFNLRTLPGEKRAFGSETTDVGRQQIADVEQNQRDAFAEYYKAIFDNPERRAELEKLLNMPIDTMANWKTRKKGVVTQHFLLMGYEQFFKEIGFNWDWGTEDVEQSFVAADGGAISGNQIGGTPIQDEKEGTSEDARVSLTDNEKYGKVTTNLLQEIKTNKPNFRDANGNPNTSPSQVETALSFWPPILEAAPVSDPPQALFQANITNIELSGTYKALESYVAGSGVTPTTYDLSNVIVVTFDRDIQANCWQFRGLKEGAVSQYADISPPRDRSKPDKITLFAIDGTFELNNTYGGDGYYLLSLNPLDVSGNQPSNQALLVPYSPDAQWYGLQTAGLTENLDAEDVINNLSGRYSEYVGGGAVYDVTARRIDPNIGDVSRTLRPMTLPEKEDAERQGWAPIWLNPGVVNPAMVRHFGENWVPEVYDFTYNELQEQFGMEEYIKYAQGEIDNLPMVPVLIPGPRTEPVWEKPTTITGSFNGDGIYYGSTTNPRENRNTLVDDVSQQLFTNPRDSWYYPVYDAYTNTLVKWTDREIVWNDITNEYTAWMDVAAEPYEDFHPGRLYTSPLNPREPLIHLEPTLQTWKYLADVPISVNDYIEQITPPRELLASGQGEPGSPPKASKLLPPQKTNGWVSLSTEGDRPNITESIVKALNAINIMLVGMPDKLAMIPVETSQFSNADLDELFAPGGTLAYISEELKQRIRNESITLLVIGPVSSAKKFADIAVRRVRSFPHVNGVNSKLPPTVINLDYGTQPSIVTDFKFEGNARFLLGIPQATYLARYYSDTFELFDEPYNQGQMISSFIGGALQADIERLRLKGDAENELLNQRVEQKSEYSRDRRNIETKLEINSDLLALLPELVPSFSDSDLALLVGEENVKALKLLSSLSQNPVMFSLLFPDATLTDNTNILEGDILLGDPNSKQALSKKEKTTIIRRRVDFSTSKNRLSNTAFSKARALMDTNYFFTEAMLQHAWRVEIETLGIPEIDNPLVEFLSRKILLNVFDARVSSLIPHWTSGVYRITGFSHTISPSEGFKTGMNLIKQPTSHTTFDTASRSTKVEVEEEQ